MDCILPTTKKWPVPKLSDSVFSMFSMKGKVAIITGGSGDIGYAIARGLAEAGADVVLTYNSAKNTDEFVAAIQKDFGVKAKAYKCAVNIFEEVKATVGAVVSDFGRLDVMIANAGIAISAGGIDDSIESWSELMSINLDGAYYCAKVAGEIFRRQGSGNLIFTASISGHIVNVPQPQVAYNASKAALIQMSKSLAVEWAAFARVNTVSPGYIDTKISDGMPQEGKEQ